jgi:hypothetical protein
MTYLQNIFDIFLCTYLSVIISKQTDNNIIKKSLCERQDTFVMGHGKCKEKKEENKILYKKIVRLTVDGDVQSM